MEIVGLLRPARHSLIPRPRSAFRRLQYEKAGRAWYLFSHEHDVMGYISSLCLLYRLLCPGYGHACRQQTIFQFGLSIFKEKITRKYVGYSWPKQHLEIYQIANFSLVSRLLPLYSFWWLAVCRNGSGVAWLGHSGARALATGSRVPPDLLPYTLVYLSRAHKNGWLE